MYVIFLMIAKLKFSVIKVNALLFTIAVWPNTTIPVHKATTMFIDSVG